MFDFLDQEDPEIVNVFKRMMSRSFEDTHMYADELAQLINGVVAGNSDAD